MKMALVLIGGALLVAGLYVFYTYSPYDSGIFPRCPVNQYLGVQCSGCGSQRAIHDLLHLRVGAAFSANALVVLGIPYLLLGYFTEWQAGSSSWWSHLRRTLYGANAIWIVLAIILVFTVGRNIW